MFEIDTPGKVLLAVLFSGFLIGLLAATIFKAQDKYLAWTKKQLTHVLKTYWRYLLCIAFGYLIAQQGIIHVQFH